uniref:Uncharacterized protein n=1 Tax=Alexandrium catenella TaxID=2925 RepID=A0A7S1SAX7_ALECA|mmetsp:Transcript_92999/g.247019  ORF Transcript_92999/g.247019 Transcript_92999/m.247019 type:complete len:529 (+) Transcript_92999:54-1640(+)
MAEDMFGGIAGIDEAEASSQPPILEEQGTEADGSATSAEDPEERREDDANDAIGQLLASLVQCTGQAMTLRKGDQPGRAIRLMERAVKMCQGREHSHPALAVEASRARLNLAGLLSSAGRHMEAVDVIKDAQFSLGSILAWVSDCEPGDPGVDAIATEARSLQCAALVAEAIELEPFAGAGGGSPGHSTHDRQPRRGMHEELYHEARSVAKDRLPNSHPMASLAARLSEECAVSARPAALAQPPPDADRGAGAPARGAADKRALGGSGSSGNLVLPAVPPQGIRSTNSAAIMQSMPAMVEVNSEVPPATPMLPGERGEVQPFTDRALSEYGFSEAGGLNGSPVLPVNSDANRSAVTRRSRTSNAAVAGHVRQPKGPTNHDVFTDFLRGAELEKEARLGPLHESMQDDVRKRLSQVHRTTRLQLELLADDDLKEKRYTRTGHRVFMRNLTRDNSCRSDPNLVSEARKLGESPELAQVKKLYRQLYIPPRTPEPVVKVVPKPLPEVDFLKESGATTFKRTRSLFQERDVF